MTKDEIREVRRSISGWLTDQMNDLTSIEGITSPDAKPFDYFLYCTRENVFFTLQTLNNELKNIDQAVIEKHRLKTTTPVTCFYMKGGNAFRFNIDGDGFGKSDWDTQVMINPWLPQPVINTAYELIEDLVVRLFKELSDDISELNEAFLRTTSLDSVIKKRWQIYLISLDTRSKSTKPEDALNAVETTILNAQYQLNLDSSQSLLKVFPHQPNGLWLNTGQPIKANKYGPGMILNNAIKPFVLYRLGYVWHAETDVPDHDMPSAILMELIDVTIPRKHTVEAISTWEEIQSTDITLGAVKISPNSAAIQLPFPNDFYHAIEQLTMLCEIADGSSKHANKIAKRFARFAQVWNKNSKDGVPNPLLPLVLSMNGSSISPPIDSSSALPRSYKDTISKLRSVVPDAVFRSLDIPKQDSHLYLPYYYAINLMDNVKKRSIQAPKKPTPQSYDGVKAPLKAGIRFQAAAISDDLPLFHEISKNDYIELSHLPNSHVDKMLVVRVEDKSSVTEGSSQFVESYCNPAISTTSGAISTTSGLIIVGTKKPLHARSSGTRITGENSIRSESIGQYQVASLNHNSEQLTRITYGKTLVIKDKTGQIVLCITFTNANQYESPFEGELNGSSVYYANLALMAEQRRIAAALIHDYVIRTALSIQIDTIDSLIQGGI
ncbi:hypothetical protein EYS14_00945 [Alteromonadaceae bacterium M269]|nr:hypothetical protein EYS14_00945 [Alteromonadaceae bacterium M269]